MPPWFRKGEVAHAAMKEGLRGGGATRVRDRSGGIAQGSKRWTGESWPYLGLALDKSLRGQVGLGRKESDIMLTASSKHGRMVRGNSIHRLPITRERSDRKLRR